MMRLSLTLQFIHAIGSQTDKRFMTCRDISLKLSLCMQITFGCCTADVLRHLSSEEVSRTPSGVPSDRITRLASHLLAQRRLSPLPYNTHAIQSLQHNWDLVYGSLCLGRRVVHASTECTFHWCSFYPLFPPAQGVPLDLSVAPRELDIPSTPDLLLLPSNLAPFVKVCYLLYWFPVEFLHKFGVLDAIIICS